MVRTPPPDRKYSFESIQKLLGIISAEKTFQIQVFSLESIEVFEKALLHESVVYKKAFTSAYVRGEALTILLKDSEISTVPVDAPIILYSNARDARFVPYKFKLTAKEKERILEDSYLCEAYKASALTSIVRSKIDISSYTASSIDYVSSVILFCMVREKRFSRLCNEIRLVDSTLDNRFVIKCGLNSLLKMHLCKKAGSSYTVNVGKDTLEKICEKIGFGNFFN